MLRACGGWANAWYAQFDVMLLWEAIETIELVAEIKQPASSEVDIFEAYGL